MDKSAEYTERINRVLDYLSENYAEDVSLAKLASIAHFSEYHFHRIFKAHVGEPLYRYTVRLRCEKAAQQLRYDRSKSITAIALDCGFSSPATFARSFKEQFGMSGSRWRDGEIGEFSKDRKVFSKEGKLFGRECEEFSVSDFYIDSTTNNLMWRIDMVTMKDVVVEVRDVDPFTVAYKRHIGKFVGEQQKWGRLFGELTRWAGARGLIHCPGTEYLTVFRDDLNITDFTRFKADVALTVESGTKPEGDIGISELGGRKYAVAGFEIDADQYEDAWDLLFKTWLPQSGYQPDDSCCFEKYLNDPKRHPQNRHFIEIYIPVKPL